ncbi:hypothetical protein F511_11067 [Dorcoceras hygrometricum]|uniref:Uncharacterized protein n=1 Tax=Dorcoceras hygrometricum TaxID=472368 RepID=A0A2Z7AIJ0_9LAMI|nr:hypothetical protein F511_11067 [Dorcoceras hygrometricum]
MDPYNSCRFGYDRGSAYFVQIENNNAQRRPSMLQMHFRVYLDEVPTEFLSVALILEKLAAAVAAGRSCVKRELSEEVTRVSQHFGVLTIDSAGGFWNQQIC